MRELLLLLFVAGVDSGVQDVPSAPEDVSVEPVNATAVRLSWARPESVNGVLLGYYVYKDQLENGELLQGSFSQAVMVTAEKTSTVIGGLEPNAEYSFRLKAYNMRGDGAFSTPIKMITRGLRKCSQAVMVTAEKTSTVIGGLEPNAEYSFRLKAYNMRGDGAFSTPIKMITRGLRKCSQAVMVTAEKTSTVIGGLEPNAEYSFRLKAYNMRGDGAFSTPIKMITRGLRKCSQAVMVTAEKTSTVIGGLEPNAEYSFRLKAYNMRGDGAFSTPIKMITRGLRKCSQAVMVTAEKTSTVIGGLEPNAEYSFRLKAYNMRGDGAFSTPIKMITRGLPPSSPLYMTVNLSKFTEPLVGRVAWQRPAKTYGLPILEYRLLYKAQDDVLYQTKSLKDDKATSMEVSPLQQGRVYEFLLSAVNEDGASANVSERLQTPTGTPSAPPLNVRFNFPEPDVVDFTWDDPPKDQRNGPVTRYRTSLQSQDGLSSPAVQEVDGRKQVKYRVTKGETFYFQVAAGTSKGFGPKTEKLEVKPDQEDMIGIPANVRGQALSRDSVVVEWEAVPSAQSYIVQYSNEPKNDEQWDHAPVLNTETHIILRGLTHKDTYAICVRAVEGARSGKCSRNAIVPVEPRYVVRDLTATEIGSKTLSLEWSYSGPRPAKFFLEPEGRKKYRDHRLKEHDISFNEKPKETSDTRITLHSLRPYTTYTVKVGVIIESSGRRFWPSSVVARTRAELPPFLVEPKAPKAINSHQARLTLMPATEEYGPVSHYWLVVVPLNVSRRRDPKDFSNSELEALSSATVEPKPDKPYIAANISRQHMQQLTLSPRGGEQGAFTLGRGVHQGGFMNRQLHNPPYKAFVRAFINDTGPNGNLLYVNSDYNPGLVTTDLKQKPIVGKASNVWLVGPIVAILIITLIIGMLVIWWMKRNRKQNQLPTKQHLAKAAAHPSETSKLLFQDPYGTAPTLVPPGYDPALVPDRGMELRSLPPQPVQTGLRQPVPITELDAHIAHLKANDNLLFQQEYESIETGQQFTWEQSQAEVNRGKNRYANVIAYDHSRVVLSSDGAPGSDYINANFIDGYRKPKAYIATQGPLPETFADFWRMVWEQRSMTIVMLTKLEERTRIKCDHYWPLRGTLVYGDVSVSLVDTFQLAHYTIRTFRLHRVSNPSEVRDIRQLQYTAWPDHGVPDHPTPFLCALKRVKAINPPDAGPILTHCSAGVGRTGAYIVVDVMLDRLRFESTIDIYGCVTALRGQRNYMVQTADQYEFIHDAVLDAVLSGSTEVPAGKLYTHMQTLVQPQPMDKATGMELEFRHLAAQPLALVHFQAANQPANKPKNRLVNILPFDASRVCLAPNASLEGSDYINASWVDGYRSRCAYIATQGPLPQTVEDFWRMVWEQNVAIVVMLTKLREMGREKCAAYWPSERSERVGSLVVEPIAEYNMPQYVLREFKLTETTSGESRTLRHFQYSEWPEQGVPKSAELFIEFIGQVHKTKEQFGAEGPIVVHCSAGVGRTGVFITLSIVLERMRFENVVDVFTTVKLLRTQRANLVQSEDQYHFCYQAALEYLASFDHYAVQG